MTLDNFLRKITDRQSLIILGPTQLSKQETDQLNSLEADIPILIVDGGMNHFDEIASLTSNPYISIGDNDSNKTDHNIDIILERQKDYSDLQYSLSCLTNLKSKKELKITMLGFLGGRIDHQLVNFGEVHHFLKDFKSNCLVYFSDTVVATNKPVFDIMIEKTFSILSLTDQYISIEGDCKYDLSPTDKLRALSSLTLSNVGHGKVTIKAESPFLVLFA